MISDVYEPVVLAVPELVLLSAVVGVPDVFHTTPCAIGLGLPKLVIFPFAVAVVWVMAVTVPVDTVASWSAMKET